MILLLEGNRTAAMILPRGPVLLQKTQPRRRRTAASDFTLNAQDNTSVSLREFRGKWVVLYFYPKDFTSGCTIEARNFSATRANTKKRNAAILGVSTQDEKTHTAFCAKEGFELPFTRRHEGEVSRKYGSILSLGVTKLSSRHTFLIDPQGVIRKRWMSVGNFTAATAGKCLVR